MKTTTAFALLCGLRFVSAALGLTTTKIAAKSLVKRTYWDVCHGNYALSGVPFTNRDNFKLALENNYSEQCPPVALTPPKGDVVVSKVCLDFVGPNIYFNFTSFPGYSTKSASVAWKLAGNALNPSQWTSPSPTTTISYTQGSSGFFLQAAI